MSKSNSFSFPENVSFNAEAWDDFQALNHSLQIPVVKAICKVAENPRPRPDGYGKPLAGKLSSYCKIKLALYPKRRVMSNLNHWASKGFISI